MAGSVVDWDKSLTRLALILPVAHIAACTLFLLGYSSAFGDNVEMLFSPGDFFNVSVGHLFKIYITAFLVPAAFLFMRHRSSTPYLSDKIDQEVDPEKKAEIAAWQKSRQNLIKYTCLIIALTIIPLIIAQIFLDIPRNYFLVTQFLQLSLTFLYWKLCNRINFYGFWAEFVWIAFGFIVAAVAVGADQGLKDRRYPISSLNEGRFKCGDNVVLMKTGEKFIAANRDNQRFVIGEDCKIQFLFEDRPIMKLISVYEAIENYQGK